MKQVYKAQPYRSGQMGSFGNAACMLLRQYQFPDTYQDHEHHVYWDSDRCFSSDFDNARRCFEKHTGTGELGFESWLSDAKDQQVIDFIVDILKADKNIKWTGYRALGSVHRGNGYPVWTLEVFAKDPASDTKVYSGFTAPNVRSTSEVE